MRVPEATYLAWLDCRALELPCPGRAVLFGSGQGWADFGETFGADYAGFARLNFATPAAILREIVTRMGEAVRRRVRLIAAIPIIRPATSANGTMVNSTETLAPSFRSAGA